MSLEIVKFLLTYKWTDSYTAYGSKKNPDPRDGFYKHICAGVEKTKTKESTLLTQAHEEQMQAHEEQMQAHEEQIGIEDPKVYEKMTRLQQVLKTPCRVEMINTKYVIGASMYVRKEDFDKFWEELCQMRHVHLLSK